jgi:hypothetical protein
MFNNGLEKFGNIFTIKSRNLEVMYMGIHTQFIGESGFRWTVVNLKLFGLFFYLFGPGWETQTFDDFFSFVVLHTPN